MKFDDKGRRVGAEIVFVQWQGVSRLPSILRQRPCASQSGESADHRSTVTERMAAARRPSVTPYGD